MSNSLYISKIKNQLTKNKISIKTLAEHLQITEQGLHGMFKNNTVQVKTLYLIAEFLNVPVTYFFEESENDKGKEVDRIFEVMKDLVKKNM